MPLLFGANSKTLPYNGKTKLGFLVLVAIVPLYVPCMTCPAGLVKDPPWLSSRWKKFVVVRDGWKKNLSLRRQRLKNSILFFIPTNQNNIL